MPSYVSHNRTAENSVGFEHAYIKEVKSIGADLGTPDTFTKFYVRTETDYDEGFKATIVNGDGKKPIGVKYEPAANTLIIRVKDFSINPEKFIKNAVNKYYSMVFPVGPEKGIDGSTGKNMFKLRFFPILLLDPNYMEKTPEQDSIELKFFIMPNPTSSSITLADLDEATGLTNGAAEMRLDGTSYGSVSFSVAPGLFSDVQECKMSY